MIASTNNAKGKAYPVSDFLPRVEPKARPRRMDPAEMIAVLRAAAGG